MAAASGGQRIRWCEAAKSGKVAARGKFNSLARQLKRATINAMSSHSPDEISFIGRTTFRLRGIPFGVRQRDRLTHMYVIGKTGTGKSTLIRNLVLQDIEAGRGVALFDPHGDMVNNVIANMRAHQLRDAIYLNVPDPDLLWSFNPFENLVPGREALAAASLIDVFKKMWPDEWGPRLEHLLRNVVFTLLESPGATLADIPGLLSDKDHRKKLVSTLTNEVVRDYWSNEFEKYSQPFRSVVVAPLQNKIGALLTDPTLMRILTGRDNTIDLRRVLDEGRVLLVNLDKGRIGEGPAMALGSFLVSHLALAGLARSDTSEHKRKDFFIYLDEFHTFATLSLTTMLSELRKYRVGLVLAHQYLGQLELDIRDAVFGNVGSLLSFRVGAHDAMFIAHEFAPKFAAEDLIRLPRFHMYLRLMIDGQTSEPFSAETVASIDELHGRNTRVHSA